MKNVEMSVRLNECTGFPRELESGQLRKEKGSRKTLFMPLFKFVDDSGIHPLAVAFRKAGKYLAADWARVTGLTCSPLPSYSFVELSAVSHTDRSCRLPCRLPLDRFLLQFMREITQSNELTALNWVVPRFILGD